MDTEKRTVKIPIKASYGVGLAAIGIKENAFDFFLLFFYTQVVGLSGTLAGTAILIALVIDAIGDPAVGYWSDNIRSKWGRRHPFMYASVIPLALSFVMLFNPPDDMSQAMTFSWLLVSAIAVRIAITFYSVPSSSLAADMTSNYNERTSLISFRIFFGWAGSIGLSYIAYTFIFAPSANFEDGRFDPSAYQSYALIAVTVMVVTILISAIGTHRFIPRLQEGSGDTVSFKGFFGDVKTALKAKPFLTLLIAVLIISVANGFREVIDLYMNTYFWRFSTDNIAFLLVGKAIAALLLFATIKQVSKRFDKKKLIIRSMVFMMFAAPLPVLLSLVGILPNDGGNLSLYVIFAQSMILVYFGMVTFILAGSMVADSIDQNELATGKRQSGLFFAATTFAGKATSGLGGFVAGVTLDIISFPRTAASTEVAPATLDALGTSNVVIILFFWIGALFTISRYSLTKEKHAEIIAELKKRET